ncbi:hypothetical protein EDD85DRAFT_952081 [Armillaria nabsnona]|nr:hypothetical protein EDD85DRAFT_952081 [Armillaria nabsnona]
MAQEDTKIAREAPKADSNTDVGKAPEQAGERKKETPLPGDLSSSDQAPQESPVEDADRAAESDPVSKVDKDLEGQQTQD